MNRRSLFGAIFGSVPAAAGAWEWRDNPGYSVGNTEPKGIVIKQVYDPRPPFTEAQIAELQRFIEAAHQRTLSVVRDATRRGRL